MELSKKVIEYQKGKDELVFNDIFRIIHNGGKFVETMTRKFSNLDKLDIESLINEKILNLVESYDSTLGKFGSLVYTSVHNGCLDLVKKTTTEQEYRTEVWVEDEEGEFDEVYEVFQVAPTTTEDDIINEVRKNRDQRQLITILIAKADEPTKLTISAFMNTNSYRQAAKQVDTCHKTVKSRIERLSRNFNREKLGDYRDYFIVPTVKAS